MLIIEKIKPVVIANIELRLSEDIIKSVRPSVRPSVSQSVEKSVQ